tara:strand:- start:60 stop:515 length:456 start_codon:yes stop_codon:yes gene_type:complete
MKDKNTVTERPEEISIEDKTDIANVFDKLPDDTFVAVPDDNIVYIGLSGLYIRQLQYVEGFITSLIPEDKQEELYLSMKDKSIDKEPESFTAPERSLLILKELLFETRFQAAKQKADAVYDRDKIAEVMDDLNQTDKFIQPLTQEELKEKV